MTIRLPPTISSLLARSEAQRRLGPFQLLRQLGRGGFAPVWLAREVYGATALRTAAVKLFSLDADGYVGADRDQIVREARALCQVEHPNVVRFYSLPIDEAAGVMGLAMEHVAGTPLDQRLATQGRLSVPEAIAVGTAVASALSAVHHAGLVHRDVKPGNVVETAGVYKLIDFGIAAAEGKPPPRPPGALTLEDLAFDATGEKMSSLDGVLIWTTEEGGGETLQVDVLSGTIGYIDPTCVSRGVPATAASDLYALGAMLFECLVGKVPAAAAAPPSKGLKGDVLDGRASAPPILDILPELSPALAALIDRLLVPDQASRTMSAELVATQLEQIRTERDGALRALPPEDVGPFRGLGRYKEGDRDVYFGRSSEIAAALESMRSRGLVALVGPSGSGKSSLARAGILPAIASGALGGWPKRWDTAAVEPGQHPRSALGAALSPFVPDAALRSPEALIQALAERAQATGWGVTLLVDQLEELATLSAPSERAWAATLLARIGEQALPGVRIIVTARRDMLDPLLAIGDLGRVLVRRAVLIDPINEVVWADVLDQSLAAYGYSLEDEALKETLVADLKISAGAMPLVQFALSELWSKRDTARKKITRAGLSAIGGIAGALERHADATLAALSRAHGEGAAEAARKVLVTLTTPQGTGATRPRKELLSSAGPFAAKAVETLEEARLITPGPQGMALAHEALLEQWGALRRWLAEVREARLLAAELEGDARRWQTAPNVAPLWRGHRLRAGERLFSRGEVDLSTNAAAFLKAARWAERRTRLLGGGFAVIALLALLVTGVLYVSSLRKERETTSRALITADRSRAEAEKQAQAANASRKEAEMQARIAEESRREAELRAEEVRKKQSEIDELLGKLERERDKSQRVALEQQIRRRLNDTKPTPPPVRPPASVLDP